jgi:ribosomal protein S18 acetylase RimI-like enzyme
MALNRSLSDLFIMYEIQRARPEDAAFIRRIAIAAYSPYIRRIGRKPAPMIADFPALIAAGEVWTISEIADIVGFVVLRSDDASLHVENVAVDPEQHGRGLGRALLTFAEDEARRRGFHRLDLYTNAKMRENLALYPLLGWKETGRRHENGFDRVYFEKLIG